MQKFEAIKKSKKSKKQQLLDKFFLYTFIAFTCSILCSSPFWVPYLKGFLFISLPKMSLTLYSPKLLFLLGNLIVVVLIGESKYFATSGSGGVYYDEYVDHQSRSLSNSSTMEVKEEKKMMIKPFEEETVTRTCLLQVSVIERLVEVKQKNDLEGEHDDEVILPTEELNKRADDFIARIKRQRKLEAKLLLK